ncbi:CARDB domain-containing protein [Caproiciproducens galactitolivorans]|uniref:Glycosyl hydrolase family 28-related protein n=1 Tax=Caproiciproducens galactitolivorans TaxID=642589 RepID=A0ABT4BRW8_9FIRM|nr:CARDB domain-containing protein [Caproiciproducens galactitolivorans]MCY1712693.1 glycosyl hydrolase family 28-related protein [Caproiciproducens galactitolivorans]
MKMHFKRYTHVILALAIIFTQSFVSTPAAYAADTTNLAAGKTITANNYTQIYVPANANDGNINTYWEGEMNSYPNTLTADLGSSQSVSKVVLKLNPSWQTRTQTLSVLSSTDNSNYVTLVSSSTYTFDPSSGNTVTIAFTETSARYIRLNFMANSGATGGQVAEFEVYGPSSTTTGEPDLVVTDITWNPVSPAAGNAVTFSATIKNRGTGETTAGVINGVSFFVDGTQVSWSDNNTSSIAAGDSIKVTASGGPNGLSTWAATPGSHTIMAWVDDVNRITESNESNNKYSKMLTIGGTTSKPDLIVTDILYSPITPKEGDEVTFSAVVKNQGTTDGAAGIVAFQVDGGRIATSANNTVPIAAGSTSTIKASSTWTAVNGVHSISATADSSDTTAETDETNNTYSLKLAVGNLGHGATVPYHRYEAEDASIGGGAILRSAPDFNYDLIAAEASNQKYVALPTTGSYVEWAVNQGGAGVDLRFTMPDSSDGMGLNGSLDCYVNGKKVTTIPLSSYWSWQYFNGDQPQDIPNGSQAAFRFDEVHWKLPTELKSGDKLRIQKTNEDSLEYGVDFVEIEPIPPAISQPPNSLSVTDYGANPDDDTDDLAAFNSCVNAATASGKSVYIPAGKFHLGGMWTITANNITITGAGIWYTNLQFTSPNAASGGISFRITGTVDFSNVYINSRLRSRYNQNAIYKCFMDNFGINSKIHDFWEDHFESGFWVADYAHTPVVVADNLLIENGRVRNNLADGVNFCQGTKNSTVRNCSIRNNGDDGLAMWSDNSMNAPMEVNNSFLNNTIENNWRAAAIAIFGGSGHKAQYNYIKDCFMGSGIRLNTVFSGYHFENNTGITFSDTTIINSGTSKDCYNGERGAIDLEASKSSIQNITFEKIDIINSQRDAIQIGYNGGFSGIVFRNIHIDGTGKDEITTSRFSSPHLGEAIYTYTGNGSATFINLTTSNIEAPEKYLIQSGFNIILQ